MPWLEKIRSKSNEEKMRLIWFIVGGAALCMVALWVLTARLKPDTSLFHILKKDVEEGREQIKTK